MTEWVGPEEAPRSEGAPKRRRRKRLLLIVGVIVMLAGGFVGWKVYDETVGLWTRLRDTAADLDPPEGFVETRRAESGTSLCVISCDEARIEIDYNAVGFDEVAVCEAVRRSLEPELHVTSPPRYLFGCLYAELPSVGDDAFLQVVPRGCPSVREPGCRVQVIVNSGID